MDSIIINPGVIVCLTPPSVNIGSVITNVIQSMSFRAQRRIPTTQQRPRPQRMRPSSKSPAKSKKSVTPPSCKSECSFAIIHPSGKSVNPRSLTAHPENGPGESGTPHQITPLAQPPEIQVKTASQQKIAIGKGSPDPAFTARAASAGYRASARVLPLIRAGHVK